jgi:hypothetical protein
MHWMKKYRMSISAFARRVALALLCLVTLVACGLGSAAQSTTSSPSPSQPTATRASSGGGGGASQPILWTHLAASDDRILLYQRSSHTAKIAQVGSNGSLAVMKTYAGTMDDWTHIVGAGEAFLFYNRDTRAAAVAHVATDGSLIYVKRYGAGSFGDWTHIAGSDAGVVFYNHDTCGLDAYVFSLADDGSLVNQIRAAGYKIGCPTIVSATKRGDFLFYNGASGSAAFGTEVGGEFPSILITMASDWGPWTHMVGTTDLFFFYNRANHQPFVGRWDTSSKSLFNLHDYQPGDVPDFNLLAATSDHIVYYNSDPEVHAGGVWKLNEDGALTNPTKF